MFMSVSYKKHKYRYIVKIAKYEHNSFVSQKISQFQFTA